MSGLTAGSFVIGTFNALAFTGTSFLFRSIDKSGYQKEARRHNLAMEELAAAKEEWYQEQVKRKEKMTELRRDIAAAGSDISATNRALLQVQKLNRIGMRNTREPRAVDFYKPSSEMRDLQHALSAAAGLGMGVLGAILLL